ncbi:hypothetical protein QAD02_003818 [Eretmocerus hayati]|uniref:Uncharacterized protein n=1 Tax=Eretmocerus hayati TaxID=131215 RepID=A0ACC2NQI4_9HYME|nr:hypothetical protein QAD02_003818 [Eretmocerus hayati]
MLGRAIETSVHAIIFHKTVLASLLLLLACQNRVLAVIEDPETTQPVDTTTPTTISSILSRALQYQRQARSEPYFRSPSPGSRYSADDAATSSSTGSISSRAAPASSDLNDDAYYDARCLTCGSAKAPAVVRQADRDYTQGRWRQKYDDYYYDDAQERRYRERYDGYYDRGRLPPSEYDRERDRDRDRYGSYGRNELFKPTHYDRYDQYNDPYNDRWPIRRPLIESELDRPVPERPLMDRPGLYDSRSYDRSNSDRGNGYDNLDPRYRDVYHEDRFAAKRPPAEEYGAPLRPEYNRGRYDPRNDPRYDRYYNDRYDPRYDPYDPARHDPYYDRNTYRRPQTYDDRNYRPRDYWYDSTASPAAGSHSSNYYNDRPESSTKADTDKSTNSPQNQENSKNYKD